MGQNINLYTYKFFHSLLLQFLGLSLTCLLMWVVVANMKEMDVVSYCRWSICRLHWGNYSPLLSIPLLCDVGDE